MAGTRMAAVLRSTALPVEPGVTHPAGVWEEGPIALRLVVDVPQNDSLCVPGPTAEQDARLAPLDRGARAAVGASARGRPVGLSAQVRFRLLRKILRTTGTSG